MLTNEWKRYASVVTVMLVMATMTPAALAKSAGKKSVEEAASAQSIFDDSLQANALRSQSDCLAKAT
jgi:hypothetical protein